MARLLRARDLATLEGLYALDFRGRLLGLTDLQPVDNRDDVRIYALQSKGEASHRQAALVEWQAYLEGFAPIEEVRLHVHRLENWRGTDEVVASVRYELIGVPKGEPYAGIDRAYFRMHFDASQTPFRIRRAELIEGDRVISSRPLFVEVAAKAGIGADNSTTVASWADYNNDGWLALYVGRYLDPRKHIPTMFYARNGEGN